MRNRSGEIFKELGQNKPELVKKEIDNGQKAGKILIASSKYLFPEIAPLTNAVEGGLSVYDYVKNPDTHNTASLMTEAAPFINNKYSKAYQVMGDYLTGQEVGLFPEDKHKYGGIHKFEDGGIEKEVRSTADNTNVAQPIITNIHNKYNSKKDYQSHLLDPYTAEKRNAQVEWLNKYKVINKDKIDNYESSFIPTSYVSGFKNEGKDTVIDLKKNNLSFARIGEVVKGNTILGGDFIFNDPTAYYATDYKKNPKSFKNVGHPNGLNNETTEYYGIQNNELKIGKINDFNDSTVVVPAPGNFNYNSAYSTYNKGSGNTISKFIHGTDNYVHLKDESNKDINLRVGKGKFIVHSPSTGAQEFVYGKDVKSLTNKINDFKKRNPDAKLLQIDNGRFHKYLSNPKGLTKEDYEAYAALTTKTKLGQGYNLIATPKK